MPKGHNFRRIFILCHGIVAENIMLMMLMLNKQTQEGLVLLVTMETSVMSVLELVSTGLVSSLLLKPPN